MVQGLGAALLVPTTLAIIMATFTDARERTAAIGIWTAIGAMALAFGPLIGGFISQHLHWGWIFFINVPVGIVAFAIALGPWTSPGTRRVARRLDLPGLVTSAVALFALTYALIEGHDKGWTSALILGAFALAAVAAAAFVRGRVPDGAPDGRDALFRSRAFGGGTATMMLWAFGIFGIYFFTSIYLQDILGFSPTKAGLAFVPMALCLARRRPVRAAVTRCCGAPDGRGRDGGDGGRPVPVLRARRRRDLRQPDARLPAVRLRVRPDAGAADQRGAALSRRSAPASPRRC